MADIQFANDFTNQRHYAEACSQRGKVCLEYVWIIGNCEKLCSKIRIVDRAPWSIDDVQEWNFDGSGTGQAQGANSDIYLKPVAMFMDPFLGGENRLVLCETMLFDRSPIKSNRRHSCANVMQEASGQDPWFGVEQQYYLTSLGWQSGERVPGRQAPYYCGVAGMCGRSVAMAHLKACLHAGIKISGVNAEVRPSGWEYQIGPCKGIDIGDHLWMSRYILCRVASEFNTGVSIEPRYNSGDLIGLRAHINFSSNATRDKATGLKAIHEAIEKLSKKHLEYIRAFDPWAATDNSRRLFRERKLADPSVFSHGVAEKNVSIRIPAQVNKDGYGYLEDRRPDSNCDPYAVCEDLVRTICLDE